MDANHGIGIPLYATAETIVDETVYGYVEYSTVGVNIPSGMIGLVFPSDTIHYTGLILSNGVCLIPPGEHVTIKLRFKHIKNTAKYNIGDEIGRLLVFGNDVGTSPGTVEDKSADDGANNGNGDS